MEGLSPLHLIIVLVIAVLVLGPGKLPEVGTALGKSIREFRKASTDVEDAMRVEPLTPTAAAATPVAPAPVAPTPVTPAPVAPPPAASSAGMPAESTTEDSAAS